MTSIKCCHVHGWSMRRRSSGLRPGAGRPVPRQALQRGGGRAGRVHPVRLLVLQRDHPLVAETAVDAVPHECQLDDLGGEVLDRLRGGLPAEPRRRRRSPACGCGSSPARSPRSASPGRPPPCRAAWRRRFAAPCGGSGRRARSPARRSAPSRTRRQEVRLDAQQRRAVPQGVHDHRADVAEQDVQPALAMKFRCCSAKYTPMANIVVNSEWANGAMISRSAAVASESPSDSPPPM